MMILAMRSLRSKDKFTNNEPHFSFEVRVMILPIAPVIL